MADFSYFDQYHDIKIDLTTYLKTMPITGSTYTLSNMQPVITSIKDLFTKFDLILDYKNNIDLILRYTVKENETIEMVSYELYESVEYWWLVALFNDIREPFNDWPLSNTQIITIAKDLYEYERKYSFNTYLTFISDKNDSKRNIIAPKVDAIKDIIWKYRQAIMIG